MLIVGFWELVCICLRRCVFACTGVHWCLLGCTGMSSCVHKEYIVCTGRNCKIVYFGVNGSALWCTGVYTSVYWSAHVSINVYWWVFDSVDVSVVCTDLHWCILL